jgi:hypothetical protein
MQTEGRVTCPSCGGDNPKAAAFCWRCYASFSSMTSASASASRPGCRRRTPVGSRGRPADAGSATDPDPDADAVGWLIRDRPIGVGALVAFVVAFGVRSVLNGGPSLPDTLAGTPRMTSQDADGLREGDVDYGERYDLSVAAGAYGTGRCPRSSSC